MYFNQYKPSGLETHCYRLGPIHLAKLHDKRSSINRSGGKGVSVNAIVETTRQSVNIALFPRGVCKVNRSSNKVGSIYAYRICGRMLVPKIGSVLNLLHSSVGCKLVVGSKHWSSGRDLTSKKVVHRQFQPPMM